MDVEVGIVVVTTLAGALTWLLRLEGRVSTHEQVCAERQRHLTDRLDAIKASASATDHKLDMMGDKLDRLFEPRA
jgi:hypothetical protein